MSRIATFDTIAHDCVGTAYATVVNRIANTAVAIRSQALRVHTTTPQVQLNLVELRVAIDCLYFDFKEFMIVAGYAY